MFTSLINLSARQSWREFGPSSDAQPPPFNTYISSHKEHIPHSSCRKDTHLPLSQIPAMFSGNVALSFCVPPLRRPRPPLTRAENATNYWGSRQWSLSFNPWQVLLGYYQDVNGRDRAVWHSRDCEGFRGAHLHERALLHQLCFDITYCWIFIKRRNHFGSKSFQNQTKNTQRWFWHKKFLCALCGGYTSPKWGVEGGTQKRGRVWDTTFLTALSGRHETMSERPPEAALVRFTLISTDEPCWLWPGNRQAAPTQSTQPLMTEVQISGRSTHMVPLHIRQLSVWQQEAVAQIYVHKTTDHFNVF